MKNFLFGLILGGIIVFGYFFTKENPENTYVLQAKTLVNKILQKDSKVGIANPASTYCIENNGTLEIKDGNEGQIGICTFSDGSSCEERAFFRGECNLGNQNETNGIINEQENQIPENNEKIYCTEEQKAAEMCTMEYMPVCGSDGQTHGNICSACSKGIEYYTIGECINQAQQECPQYAPPSSDFCPNGIIQDQGTDENGCQLPPVCVE
ncbi:MAG: DUF333 domain-containing protein [Candidatus Absconditabacteria bacterium]|nr:DUF333 domain-containing protein [Candidatus Absconditabacteria bacterium]